MNTAPPPVPVPPGRGGPQHIPRPAGVQPGGPAPWAHLPPADRRLGFGSLRSALRDRPSRQTSAAVSRVSAVLVPLYHHEGELHVILTRRSGLVRTHRHEVSFPGGGREPGDPNLWATACRETAEEIGLLPPAALCIGRLKPFVTVGSDSIVHPFVAELPAGRPEGLRPDPAEVEEILHVPVSDLLAPDTYREELWPRNGVLAPITFFEIPGDTVWGATAAMLRRLLTLATTGSPR